MVMKSHIAVWAILANNNETHPKTILSMNKLAQKYGIDFFTVWLPALGKRFEASLEANSMIKPGHPFKMSARGYPHFMSEFFKKIYDKNGLVRPDCAKEISIIRQLTLVFYKFEAPFTDIQKKEAYEKFIELDRSVKTSDWPCSLSEVRKNFQTLLPDDAKDIRPHHAGGATADQMSNYEKRFKLRYIPSLMDVYGPEYFFNSLPHAETHAKSCKTLISEPVAMVTLVPKDSRGPRIICMEPHERMFIQKGLQTLLYSHIERMSPAKGFINFTDQTINHRLAQYASLDRSYYTIDLSDASDLVSWALVQELCPPAWLAALTATRSPIASVGGIEVELKKFAPMGSALCFPIEAMIFWSIAKLSAKNVWVYGDDIIVDRDCGDEVIKALEQYGLKVNLSKTLRHGHFRESCGGDFFRGHPVDYTKCKSYDLDTFVAFCNNIAVTLSSDAADQLISWYEKTYQVIVVRRPFSERFCPESFVYYTHKTSATEVFFPRRWNEDLQRFEIRTLVTSTKHKPLDHEPNVQYGHFFDWLTANAELQPESDALVRSMMLDAGFEFPVDNLRFMDTSGGVSHQDAKPGTNFVWGVHNPV